MFPVASFERTFEAIVGILLAQRAESDVLASPG